MKVTTRTAKYMGKSVKASEWFKETGDFKLKRLEVPLYIFKACKEYGFGDEKVLIGKSEFVEAVNNCLNDGLITPEQYDQLISSVNDSNYILLE